MRLWGVEVWLLNVSLAMLTTLPRGSYAYTVISPIPFPLVISMSVSRYVSNKATFDSGKQLGYQPCRLLYENTNYTLGDWRDWRLVCLRLAWTFTSRPGQVRP